MNDVLPKPFTKEGMLRALEKHLPQFKKNAPFPPVRQMGNLPPGGFATPTIATSQPLGINMGQLSTTQSLKDEASPGKSPATASSWHSPSQLTTASPILNPSGGYMQQAMDNRQFNMTPTHPHPQSGFVTPQSTVMMGSRPGPGPGPGQHRRVLSDMTGGLPEDHAEKRQRMFPPSQPGFSQ